MSKIALAQAWSILVVIGIISLAVAQLATAAQQTEGAGSYLLGPGMPTIFSFDRNPMSCAVSWGTLGAPGPGPFSDPKMNRRRCGDPALSSISETCAGEVAEQAIP